MKFSNTKLGSLILSRSFKLEGGDLTINTYALKLILKTTSIVGKRPKYKPLRSLPEKFDRFLFNKNEREELIRHLKSKVSLTRKEEEDQLHFAVREGLKERLQFYYVHLPYYSSLKNVTVNEAIVMAKAQVVVMFCQELGGDIEVMGSVLISEKELFEKEYGRSISEKLRKHFRTWVRTFDSQLIPRIFWPEKQHTRRLLKGPIPKQAENLLLLYKMTCTRSGAMSYSYSVFVEMIVNILIDHPLIPNTLLFSLSCDQIYWFLEYHDLDKRPISSLTALKTEIEKCLNIKLIHQPLTEICITVYSLKFQSDAENQDQSVIASQDERLLVFYDRASKFVLHQTYLTGEIEEFRQALCQLLLTTRKRVPRTFCYDPILNGYIDESSDYLKALGVEFIESTHGNVRLDHFLRHYPVGTDHPLKFHARVISEGRREYVVNIYSAQIDEFVEMFPITLIAEFNNSKGYKKYDVSSPLQCFNTIRDDSLLTLSDIQFASLFYRRLPCLIGRKLCYVKSDRHIYIYKCGKKLSSKSGFILIDPNNYESTGFVINEAEKTVEVQFSGKYLNDGDFEWSQELAEEPIIVDARREVSKLLRKEFMVEPATTGEFQESQTRRIRKIHYAAQVNKK